MNSEKKKTIITYGLYVGFLSVGYLVVIYVLNPSPLWLGISAFLTFLAGIGIAVSGMLKYRMIQGGYAKFKEMFTLYFLISLFSLVISLPFTALLYGVIDTDYAKQQSEKEYEALIETKKGLDQAMESGASNFFITFSSNQTDSAIEAIEKDPVNYQIMKQVKGVPASLIFTVIIALIVAAFTKKSPPIFDEKESSLQQ